jgi:hypothetical protein
MKTKVTILVLSALLCGAARADQVLEGDFPRITIGTNSYTNAHLRAYSPTEGSLRHEGGLEKIKLSDLPEPERSKFYNPQKAAEAEAAKEQARSAAQAPRTQASVNGMPYHPFRKVGDRYYNLQPLYQDGEKVVRDPEAGRLIGQGWLIAAEEGPAEPFGIPYGDLWRGPYTVIQVTSEGLLVERTDKRSQPVLRYVYFLSNYPFASSAVAGQRIRFIALRRGVRRYTDIQQGTREIQVYDYGIPCAPSQLQQDRQSIH